MKCPYACNITVITQNINEYEDSNVKFLEQKQIIKRQYIECKKEKCGAWCDGKCNYKGK